MDNSAWNHPVLWADSMLPTMESVPSGGGPWHRSVSCRFGLHLLFFGTLTLKGFAAHRWSGPQAGGGIS